MEIKTIAYPKVNLHLAVGKKRLDGFHEIASIFQLVEDDKYHDELTITLEESDTPVIKINGLEGIADECDNTIYKAISLFFKHFDISASITVNVKKGIPSQAGLGGGSSDAGAILMVLNKLFPTDPSVLVKIASLVGSDVPFFVSGCKAAVVTGRGENIYPLKAKDLKITLLPNSKEKMSTAKAYQMLDSRKHIRTLQSVKELSDMYYGPIEDWRFYNDFEMVNSSPENIRQKLTGSGTCRFVID